MSNSCTSAPFSSRAAARLTPRPSRRLESPPNALTTSSPSYRLSRSCASSSSPSCRRSRRSCACEASQLGARARETGSGRARRARARVRARTHGYVAGPDPYWLERIGTVVVCVVVVVCECALQRSGACGAGGGSDGQLARRGEGVQRDGTDPKRGLGLRARPEGQLALREWANEEERVTHPATTTTAGAVCQRWCGCGCDG